MLNIKEFAYLRQHLTDSDGKTIEPFSLPAPENRSILINEQLTSILIPQICSSELLYWRLSFWT